MNYFENPKKYRKLLWDYLAVHKEGKIIKKIDKSFQPEEHFEFIRMILHKIRNTPREKHVIKVIKEMYSDKCKIKIQEWFDISKKDGYYTIVELNEKSEHRAVYNACVEFILKTE